jgi:diacylglycerol O-acyltransferase / wax synthase
MSEEESIDRMGAFDAVMWGIEQDPILRSPIVAMVVLDQQPDPDVLIDRVTRMSLAVPRLRQRVIGNPVSLVPPRWEVDPNFDMRFHIKRFHVPADGTVRPVLRIAEQMAEQDFDKDRPLWEVAIVEGFDGPRSAVIMKMHHSITDGVGGIAMAASLFDLTRDPASDLGPMPAAPSGEVLGVSERLTHGVSYATKAVIRRGKTLAAGAVGLSTHAVSDPLGTATAGGEFAQSMGRLLAPASVPLSPLMTGRSLSAQLYVIRVPFGALKASAKKSGSTLNDAYMAAVAGGVATYHEAHNAPADRVRVNMPVNLRSADDSSGGNRWVPARFPLPIDSGDPAARMQKLSPVLLQARTEPALAISDTIMRLLSALPQAVTTSISAGMMKGCDLAVTNVPGPPIALYAAGAEVQAVVPFAPKGGAAVNVALMTYNGTGFVGVNIDTRAIPDPDVFVEHLRAGFDAVLALSTPEAHATLGF